MFLQKKKLRWLQYFGAHYKNNYYIFGVSQINLTVTDLRTFLNTKTVSDLLFIK